MTSQMINNYINKRYPYWLDYATYHATLASLHDQAGDLLHTVLESLLGKDPDYILELYEKKKGLYTELDFFILRMIKLNAYSLTSPYRHKNKGVPKDANIDPWSLEIIEEEEDEGEGRSDRILRLMRQSREILKGLNIADREKEIFAWKFFRDNPLRSWPGAESYSSVCNIYNRVLDQMLAEASPERYRIQMFCRTFLRVRPKLLKAA